MSPRTAKAILWFERGAIIEAEAELRAALAEGADTAETRAMLGLCLLGSGLKGPATQEIKTALARDPACAFAHYAMSFVEEAEIQFVQIPFLGTSPMDGLQARACRRSARRAVELESTEILFLLRLAAIQRTLFHRWRECLQAADQALALEPDHLEAAIERAIALTHLRRKAEARETLARVLAANPAASGAQAGMGWALLQAGDHERANAFFEEALRLDAGSAWAQAGALEVAKHRYRSYRVIATVENWFTLQPIYLRALYGLLALGGGGFIFVKLLEALDHRIRLRLGTDATVAVMMPLMLGVIFGIIFRHAIFNWLLRRQPAAQTSSAAAQRKAGSAEFTMLLTGLFGAVVWIVLKRLAPEHVPVIFGLLPGIWTLWLALAKTPEKRLRRWITAYGLLLVILGPLTVITWREWFSGLDRPWGFAMMMAPIVPPAILHELAERAQRQQEHDKAVTAATRHSD